MGPLRNYRTIAGLVRNYVPISGNYGLITGPFRAYYGLISGLRPSASTRGKSKTEINVRAAGTKRLR